MLHTSIDTGERIEISSLHSIFKPRSVAFVGATAATEKLGGRRWKSLVDGGFQGRLYPIHPTAQDVRGHKAFKTLHEVPDTIDLAIVAVPAEVTPAILDDCAELRIPGVVVITGGFGEISEEGRRIEQGMVAAVRAEGCRLVGPNCSGLFSSSASLNVSGDEIPAGSIALVSQSGNMALDFAQRARVSGVGFSSFVTIGNAADLRTDEFVDYFLSDPNTKVVLAYLEGFGPDEGRRLYELARERRGDRAKPFVILKPGRTEAGRRAAVSHTGSLAGEDRLVHAAFEQAGIVRAFETGEAWDLAAALACTPPLQGDGIAVLTDGGGHATLFCDTAGAYGLKLPPPGEMAVRDLRTFLPARCPIANPIDFAGEAELNPSVVARALEVCLAEPQISGAAIVGHFGGYHKLAGDALLPLELAAAGSIVSALRRFGKPVLVHSIHADESDGNPVLSSLRGGGIPVYRAVEAPAKVFGGLKRQIASREARETASPRRSPPNAADLAGPIISQAVQGQPAWLQEPEARRLLQVYGAEIPPWRIALDPEQCEAMAVPLAEKVALKLIIPEAMHKTEIGGVLLNVRQLDAAKAFRDLVRRAPGGARGAERVLVTPMIEGGVELVVGAFRDPQFGPVIMVGVGGTIVELTDDTVFRLSPIGEGQARRMLASLRIGPLFEGYRGSPALSAEAVVNLMVRVSELMDDLPNVAEVDLNPVFVDHEAARIADARVVLSAA